jgi:two-component system, cell cycle sensor histidine kinase and response regulator CckA
MSVADAWILDLIAKSEISLWELDVATSVVRYHGRLWAPLGNPAVAPDSTLGNYDSQIHPDDVAGMHASLGATLAGKQSQHRVEFRMRTPTGDWRWVEGLGRVVDRGADGSPRRMVGSVCDIHEHRIARERAERALRESEERAEREKQALEAQLRHAQRMESVGTLAGGVAHDFNNLLVAILGNADLALGDASEQDGTLREMLAEIKAAAVRGASLTRRLLTFSRHHAAAHVVVAVDDLLAELLPMLRRLLPATLELSLDARSKAQILGDSAQLEQVIVNLVVNARDAIPSGGHIEVATSLGRLDEADAHSRPWLRPGPCVHILVTDDGCGIPGEHLDRIYDPFFTTKDVGKGTGLGLSIVYGIVQQHGGRLSVRSDPGGTRVEVSLPLVEGVCPEPSNPTPETTAGGHETILLAEDEPAVRALATRILLGAGYRVVAAPNGVQALALFEEDPDRFDLALLDVVMPGLTGAQVFEKLRARRPSLRVLFSTGYSAGAVDPKLFATPRCGPLEKPYDRATLLATVRAALDEP